MERTNLRIKGRGERKLSRFKIFKVGRCGDYPQQEIKREMDIVRGKKEDPL
jgi:hypothetical protein